MKKIVAALIAGFACSAHAFTSELEMPLMHVRTYMTSQHIQENVMGQGLTYRALSGDVFQHGVEFAAYSDQADRAVNRLGAFMSYKIDNIRANVSVAALTNSPKKLAVIPGVTLSYKDLQITGSIINRSGSPTTMMLSAGTSF